MSEYIIVGDTDKYEGCLIYTCGPSIDHANQVLERMLNNPDEQDKKELERHKNIRIEPVEDDKCWWRH